jgi:hypothetical protein
MASFPPPIARTQLPHRLGVPVIKAPRGLSPPSHFPVRFRSPVIQRQFMALRAMPGAPTKKSPRMMRGDFFKDLTAPDYCTLASPSVISM